MQFSFKARIHKVGINPCVKVPARITAKMSPVKGYIPIKGIVEGHAFEQTLCPVKNDLYRLYVNGRMLKGANMQVGEIARFSIEQAEKQKDADLQMPPLLKKRLKQEAVYSQFEHLTPSRRKEILRYLQQLKSSESMKRNVEKVVSNLKKS